MAGLFPRRVPPLPLCALCMHVLCSTWLRSHLTLRLPCLPSTCSPQIPAKGHWTKETGSNFAKALRAFGERDDVNEAGGDSAVVVEEKEAEADLQPGELSREPPPSPRW